MHPSAYKRTRTTCQRTDVEKRAGITFETAWYPSWGYHTLSAPPPGLSTKSDLALGDMFCHWAPRLPEPQMWMWTKIGGGKREWKPVTTGYIRPEDNRILCMADCGEPSFISQGWYNRKLREQEAQRRRERKGKGKGAHQSSSLPTID